MCFFRKNHSDSILVTSTEDKIAKRQAKYDEPLKEYGELLQLKRIVGTTRLNRINAANRLQRTENFLQGINIYYSCYTAVLAVLSLVVENKSLSVWSAALTVILAISIVYFVKYFSFAVSCPRKNLDGNPFLNSITSKLLSLLRRS